MQIPRKLKIMRAGYTVTRPRRMPYRRIGYISYDARTIELATHGIYGKLKPREVHEAFWHELTHGILHHMQEYKLRDNERFVKKFGLALSRAVDSARF